MYVRAAIFPGSNNPLTRKSAFFQKYRHCRRFKNFQKAVSILIALLYSRATSHSKYLHTCEQLKNIASYYKSQLQSSCDKMCVYGHCEPGRLHSNSQLRTKGNKCAKMVCSGWLRRTARTDAARLWQQRASYGAHELLATKFETIFCFARGASTASVNTTADNELAELRQYLRIKLVGKITLSCVFKRCLGQLTNKKFSLIDKLDS